MVLKMHMSGGQGKVTDKQKWNKTVILWIKLVVKFQLYWS